MDILPALHPNTLLVVCGPAAARDEAAMLAVQLALQGEVTILDGGNRIQAYRMAHLLRRQTTDVDKAASRIFIRRAFTCYQMTALLENLPIIRQPVLVLDLLASFYDEQVSSREASRLLDACLRQVERIQQLAPVVISLAPPLDPERGFLVERVCQRADRLYLPEPVTPQPYQPALFPC
jgi:hypothetical protein